MTVFALFSVHGGLSYTLDCLADLRRQDYPSLRILVVDGGSKDGTAAGVSQAFPEVEVLPSPRALWWGEGMRLGAEHILSRARPGDFVLSINNDLRIADSGYVSGLVEASRSAGGALVSSYCWYRDDESEVESSGGVFQWESGLWRHSDWMSFDGDRLTGLDFLSGRGTLIPVEAFSAAGNYDCVRFPQVLTDFDFSHRAKKKGFPLLISRRARVSHLQRPAILQEGRLFMGYGQAWDLLASPRSYYCIRENFAFIEEHCPAPYRRRAKAVHLARALSVSFGRTFPLKLLLGPLSAGVLAALKGGRKRA